MTWVPVEGSSISLGRSTECDVALTIDRVSRRHCEIYRQGPLLALRDLGSTNGTWVDGRLTPHSPIRPGMLLRIGNWLGMFQQVEQDAEGDHFDVLTTGLLGGEVLRSAVKSVVEAARTSLPVVLIGESGTGKEGLARALHRESGRSGPFHAVNCAAMPLALADGELFGFEKGAFTGAERANLGHLRAAHGGTLFLDEVADLPLAVQPKLLRALQEGEVTPLGQTRSFRFDARIVVACQAPLMSYVEEQLFRLDLAYRLAGFSVSIPPLRERRSDIPSLFARFLDQHSGGRPPRLCVRLVERLCLHDWPGNVRELELVARQMLAMHGFKKEWSQQHLPDSLRGNVDQEAASGVPPGSSRDDYDRARFEAALRECGGSVKRAAASVGISRQRAYRLRAGGAMSGGKQDADA